ncbi:MAG: hypothetical protein PHH28_14015 [Desulfuromonadaceae bacterium]|nr:hypothetical protein [Desulfuromonadaceae bacterium]
MPEDLNDINTITNSGTIGAIAVGRGATAINASGDVSIVTAALEGRFAALEQLIEQHQDAECLKCLLKDAIATTKSAKPEESGPLWDKIALYGGAIGSIASGITGILGMLPK